MNDDVEKATDDCAKDSANDVDEKRWNELVQGEQGGYGEEAHAMSIVPQILNLKSQISNPKSR
jgi:hypothetical protein